MKSKKKNYKFISKKFNYYISKGITDPLEISKLVKVKISKLDNFLVKIERIKKRRADLIDLLFVLDKTKANNSKYLDFFLLGKESKELVYKLKNLDKIEVSKETNDIVSLGKMQIIKFENNYIQKGKLYKEYSKALRF